MTTRDTTIRDLVATVFALFGGPIVGVVRSASGEVFMKWEWDDVRREPRRVEG